MPDDYWPNGLIVSGENADGFKLAFAITKEAFLDDLVDETFKIGLDRLRLMLWQGQAVNEIKDQL